MLWKPLWFAGIAMALPLSSAYAQVGGIDVGGLSLQNPASTGNAGVGGGGATGGAGGAQGVGGTQLGGFDPTFGAGAGGNAAGGQFRGGLGGGLGGLGGIGGLGGFGGGLGGFGGGLGGFGGGMGGFGGGFGGRGGFGNQNNGMNESRVRATVKIGFETTLPSPAVRSSEINARLDRIPLPPKFDNVQIELDGNTAIMLGTVPTESDAALIERLLSLEPGIRGVENRLAYSDAADDVPVPPTPESIPSPQD